MDTPSLSQLYTFDSSFHHFVPVSSFKKSQLKQTKAKWKTRIEGNKNGNENLRNSSLFYGKSVPLYLDLQPESTSSFSKNPRNLSNSAIENKARKASTS